MSKCSIFYFSGTGNTWAVCELYKKYLEERGVTTELYPIETVVGTPLISDCDYIGIGFPVWAWNAPKLVRDFVEKLPNGSAKQKAFVISTSAGMHFKAVKKIHKILQDKGFKMCSSQNYILPSNYTTSSLGQPASEEKIKDQFARAEQKVINTVDEIMAEIDRCDASGSFVGSFITNIMRDGFANSAKGHSNGYFVNDKCTDCKLCIKTCPTGNITKKDGVFTFGKNCIACLRCYNICPVKAIRYKGREESDYRYKAPGYHPPVVNK
ncbi:MAG: EFR1 family ferrodoxin [Firmicutes bacterium]|nr:EFR1 family ferrodoxin [Bacillota bacterium]